MQSHLDECPALQKILIKVHSFPASAASAERNWSNQGRVISKERSRLSDTRAEQLVYIYHNSRSIQPKSQPVHAPDDWRAHVPVPPMDFPRITLEWEAGSNWSHSAAEPDVSLFEDGTAAGDSDSDSTGSSGAEDTEPALDWEFASVALLRPCPADVLGLSKGDRIVVWFPEPYSAWYVGRFDRTDRRCKLPLRVDFADGPGDLALDPAMYGVTGGREWALLQPASQPPCPLTSGGTASGSQNVQIDLCGEDDRGDESSVVSESESE